MIRSTSSFVLLFLICILTSCSKESIDEEVEAYNYTAEDKISYSYSEMESEVMEEINAYRMTLGLPGLQSIPEASYEADLHNDYMIDAGKISHDNFGLRYSSLVNNVAAKAVSENVAYGYRTAGAAVQAWIKSESHRKNMEGDHTHFGLSVKQDAQGKNYFTNIFLKK